MAERSQELDVLRASAVLAVIFGHSYLLNGDAAPRGHTATNVLLSLGASGVWMFFTLSGYLIAGPYLRAHVSGRPTPSLRRYAMRRVTRIFPAYWIALTVLLATTSAHVGLAKGLVHYALLHNLVPGEEFAVYFASWTLTLELLFYISVPIAALAARRSPTASVERLATVVVVVAAFSILLSLHPLVTHRYGPNGLWLKTIFPSMVGMFCPGILVHLERLSADPQARIWRGYRALLRNPVPASLLSALFAVSAAFANTSVGWYLGSRWLFGVSYGLLLGLVLCHGVPRVTQVLAPVGVISYGLYLWHTVFVEWLNDGPRGHWRPFRTGGFGPWVVHLAFVLLISAVFATASWIVVERPAMRWAGVRMGTPRPSSPFDAPPPTEEVA